ncbi:hypothetical protein ACFYY1_29850 [Streptomyces sp. NPDC001890]|uniref:hypothetical protein n=1 Tax=Streptomyces sp. NPDC001890 TaxID=3364620 RepID=UPI0036D0FA73
MPMHTRSVVAALGPDPTTLTHLVPYDGPRIAAADFFTQARQGRAVTGPPPFRDGDCVSCPRGIEWMRKSGRWITPGQPHGLILSDRVVADWWQTRMMPDSRFALVHRLTPAETPLLITGDHYASSFHGWSETHGVFSYDEPVSGPYLRSIAWQAARTRTVSVHLELPSGIVTLHSRTEGDVFFHPAPTARPALATSLAPAPAALCA